MKYDKMVALNHEKKQKNIDKITSALNEMLNRRERISITALAKYTELDRSYFYRNVEAHSLVEDAMLEQGECYNPKKVIFDRACRDVNVQLKIRIQILKKEIARLEKENQELSEKVIKLKEQLNR